MDPAVEQPGSHGQPMLPTSWTGRFVFLSVALAIVLVLGVVLVLMVKLALVAVALALVAVACWWAYNRCRDLLRTWRARRRGHERVTVRRVGHP